MQDTKHLDTKHSRYFLLLFRSFYKKIFEFLFYAVNLNHYRGKCFIDVPSTKIDINFNFVDP